MDHSGYAVVLRIVDQTTEAGAAMDIEEWRDTMAWGRGTWIVVIPAAGGQGGSAKRLEAGKSMFSCVEA